MSLREGRMRAVYVVTQINKRGCYTLYNRRLHQIEVYGPGNGQLPTWLLEAACASADEIVEWMSLDSGDDTSERSL